MLKFFAEKMCAAKNIRILYIESTEIVNEMTLNELIKLTMLWTTGPWISGERMCTILVNRLED